MVFADEELNDNPYPSMQDGVLDEAASEVAEAEPEVDVALEPKELELDEPEFEFAPEAEAAEAAEAAGDVTEELNVVPADEADLDDLDEVPADDAPADNAAEFVPWVGEHIAQAEPKPFTQLSFDSIALELDGKELFGATSFNIEAPEVIAITGPAAARKALLLTIAGLAKPTSGSIAIDGTTAEKPSKQLKSAVGIALFKGLNDLDEQLTVEQSVIRDLSMLRRRAKDDDVDQLLEDWDLDGIESEKVAAIEAHDRIRLGIALASIGSPSTIVVDDIETGMGAQDTLQMLNYLSNVAKTQGIAFVIGLSDDLYAKYADECIAIGS